MVASHHAGLAASAWSLAHQVGGLVLSAKISNPDWCFSVIVHGGDLLVEGTTATWFGGSNDPMDSGETACGYPTKGHPELMGCSLPMDYQGKCRATRKAVGGSPLPMMRFGLHSSGKKNPVGTMVEVTCGTRKITVPLIDIGPARWAKHGLDLTQAAFVALGGSLRRGVLQVSYRVIGGAQYLKGASK